MLFRSELAVVIVDDLAKLLLEWERLELFPRLVFSLEHKEPVL